MKNLLKSVLLATGLFCVFSGTSFGASDDLTISLYSGVIDKWTLEEKGFWDGYQIYLLYGNVATPNQSSEYTKAWEKGMEAARKEKYLYEKVVRRAFDEGSRLGKLYCGRSSIPKINGFPYVNSDGRHSFPSSKIFVEGFNKGFLIEAYPNITPPKSPFVSYDDNFKDGYNKGKAGGWIWHSLYQFESEYGNIGFFKGKQKGFLEFLNAQSKEYKRGFWDAVADKQADATYNPRESSATYRSIYHQYFFQIGDIGIKPNTYYEGYFMGYMDYPRTDGVVKPQLEDYEFITKRLWENFDKNYKEGWECAKGVASLRTPNTTTIIKAYNDGVKGVRQVVLKNAPAYMQSNSGNQETIVDYVGRVIDYETGYHKGMAGKVDEGQSSDYDVGYWEGYKVGAIHGTAGSTAQRDASVPQGKSINYQKGFKDGYDEGYSHAKETAPIKKKTTNEYGYHIEYENGGLKTVFYDTQDSTHDYIYQSGKMPNRRVALTAEYRPVGGVFQIVVKEEWTAEVRNGRRYWTSNLGNTYDEPVNGTGTDIIGETPGDPPQLPPPPSTPPASDTPPTGDIPPTGDVPPSDEPPAPPTGDIPPTGDTPSSDEPPTPPSNLDVPPDTSDGNQIINWLQNLINQLTNSNSNNNADNENSTNNGFKKSKDTNGGGNNLGGMGSTGLGF
ncbi:MAG: hypothetical protein ACOY3I_10385 [Verrucomicrobiota bacterium]